MACHRIGLATLALLFALAGCGGGGALSRSQRAFLQVYGDPVAYTVLFADAEIGADGLATAASPRRVESWVWASRRVLFDDGFFVEERALPAAVDAPPFATRPDAFSAGLTPDQVRAQRGAPAQTEESTLGAESFTVLRYDGPLSVSFLDGELASVVAGLEVQP